MSQVLKIEHFAKKLSLYKESMGSQPDKWFASLKCSPHLNVDLTFIESLPGTVFRFSGHAIYIPRYKMKHANIVNWVLGS